MYYEINFCIHKIDASSMCQIETTQRSNDFVEFNGEKKKWL